MIEKEKIKVIFFDAGGVLFESKDTRVNRVRRVLKSKGIYDSSIDLGLRKAEIFTKDLISSGKLIATWKDEEEYWEKYYKILTSDFDEEYKFLKEQLFYTTHYSNHCELFHETKEILESLKGKYRLAVISNALPSMDWVFDSLEIRKYFEKVIISAFVGAHKPEERIYRHALNHMEIEPQNCLFIDDKLENIKAAKKLGMQGIHLIREEGSSTKDLWVLRELL